jgi:hypothetical protein
MPAFRTLAIVCLCIFFLLFGIDALTNIQIVAMRIMMGVSAILAALFFGLSLKSQ